MNNGAALNDPDFYDRIAPRYDAHRSGGGPYLDHVALRARLCGARRVVEIGAGTGNNTAAFLRAHACDLLAVDLSAGMLRQAKAKGIAAQWVQAAGDRLPLPHATAGFVFGVYMLHYVADLVAFFRECREVLCRDGGLAFVTACHGWIGRHPMNRYFPSFALVDQARFPSIEQVMQAMEQAGCRRIGAETFVDAPRPIDGEYLAKVEGKFISTFELLPAAEYEAGLARLRADVAERGRLDVELALESVVVFAEK